MDVQVTDSMIDAAINRLNQLQAANAEYGVVLLPWGEIVREVYVVMEKQRRSDLVRPLLEAVQ